MLKVEGIHGGRLSLQQLLVVNGWLQSSVTLCRVNIHEGRNIGSVLINLTFSELVEERLKKAVASRTIALSDREINIMSAMAMKSSDFESTKCSFGSPDLENLQVGRMCILSVPKLGSSIRPQVSSGLTWSHRLLTSQCRDCRQTMSITRQELLTAS